MSNDYKNSISEAEELETLLDASDSSIRLKSSSDPVDIDFLPDGVVEAIKESIDAHCSDPIAIIATMGNMFSGMRINDIRDCIVLSDEGRIHHPSREFVRKKVVGMYLDIQQRFAEKSGHLHVAPLYPERNIDPDVIVQGRTGEDDNVICKEAEGSEISKPRIRKKRPKTKILPLEEI